MKISNAYIILIGSNFCAYVNIYIYIYMQCPMGKIHADNIFEANSRSRLLILDRPSFKSAFMQLYEHQVVTRSRYPFQINLLVNSDLPMLLKICNEYAFAMYFAFIYYICIYFIIQLSKNSEISIL